MVHAANEYDDIVMKQNGIHTMSSFQAIITILKDLCIGNAEFMKETDHVRHGLRQWQHIVTFGRRGIDGSGDGAR